MRLSWTISGPLLLLLCLFGALPAVAQPGRLNFTSLGTRDGLLSNSVNAIIKDRFGFIWFATNDGLDKFDGTNFTVYRRRAGDTTSLRSNEILALHEDKAGNLWIGTSGGALSMYDRTRDCFINYPGGNVNGDAHPDTRAAGDARPDTRVARDARSGTRQDDGGHPGRLLPSDLVRGVCSDPQGRIWIAQFSEPYVLNPATGDIHGIDLTRYTSNPSQKLELYCIYADPGGRVWIGTDNGLFQYLPATKCFRHFQHQIGDTTSLPDNHVRAIAGDHRGYLWVGTDKGLSRLQPDSGRFTVLRERPAAGIPAANAQINAIAIDQDGMLWAGTGDGLVVIDQRTARSVTYRPDDANPHSLTSGAIASIYIDRDGIYWVGTFKGGVDKYDKNLNLFDLKLSENFHEGGPHCTVVTSFAERPDGNLWLGTDGGGLFEFARRSGQLLRQPVYLDGKPVLPLSILSLYHTRTNKLYIGTYGKGLLQLDPATGRIQRLPTSRDADDFNANCIFCIWEDSQGRLWTGTNGSGVSVLKDGKLLFRLLPHPTLPTDIALPVNGFIRAIAQDADGNIWIGSHGDGMTIYDPQTRRFKVYNQENGALPSNKVQTFLLDSRGRMWLGTYGGGLCLYDKTRDAFLSYNEKDGLQNTNVYSLVEDDAGRIWVSTNSGVSSLDVRTNVFRNFTPHNGLQNNNFVHASVLKTADGELFFGGEQGFNYFYPSALTTNRNSPAVVLTALRVANKLVAPGRTSPIQEPVGVAGEVRLDYKQNFALSFVALNYTLPDQNRYAYKLEGFDKEWNYAGAQNTAYYMNLDPGDYIFRVKASNNDGIWSKEDTSIRIHVRPPLWRTPLAYILYVLLAGGLLWYSRHRGVARIERKFALEQERQEYRRAQELDRLKLKFLTNLSHEFRTPISLITGPVEQLLTEQNTGPTHDKLEMIRRNARRLLNLVNQLLDFRKMEEQELKLQASPGELVGFVKEIWQTFTDLGERKHIRFAFETNLTRFPSLFDRDKLERILFNLLSNAFKFTPEGGSVTLSLTQEETDSDTGRQTVRIRVIDSGIGIPTDKRQKIFERFFQHQSGATILNQGAGIGLSITKEFVLLHGGTISVDGRPGGGSIFTVDLPLTPATIEDPISEPPKLATMQDPDEPAPGGTVEPAPQETSRPETPSTRPLILLVEDNEDFRFYLKDNLRREYDIIEAANGKEGWQQALSRHPRLIVSDVSMPYMDGIVLTRKLKADKRTRNIPVILLTALAREVQQLEGLGTGANDYITKPFNFELLNARIKGLLEWSSTMRTSYARQVRVAPAEPASELANAPADEKLMKRIAECIETHLQDPLLSVKYLSRELGMSRSSLYAKMLELTGETPGEYIRSFRLEKALILLEKSDLTISEIAYEVGFTTPNYFTRAFKAKYRSSPSEYTGRTRKVK
jgi:signal transduction histidine kinase/ligand-binding sensor domain-containing protein/CheY-like chemotaxis protein/AraC-like DNA-binding protein